MDTFTPGSIYDFMWNVLPRSQCSDIVRACLTDKYSYNGYEAYIEQCYPEVWFKYKAWKAVHYGA